MMGHCNGASKHHCSLYRGSQLPLSGLMTLVPSDRLMTEPFAASTSGASPSVLNTFRTSSLVLIAVRGANF